VTTRLPKLAAFVFLAAVSLVPAVSHAQPVRDDVEYCRVNWWGVGHCWRRHHRRPALTFGLDFGAGALNEGHPFAFDSGTGSVTGAGPTWGLRLGVDVLSWLGFEGRYMGGWYPGTGAANIVGNVGYFLSSGQFIVRLTVPTPFVRPYIFSGIGIYNFALAGSAAARTASLLESTTQAGIPIGVGVELMLTWHVSVAVEGAYHFQLSEEFSKVDAIGGADLSTLQAVLRFRL
jgi:hypothetical protein